MDNMEAASYCGRSNLTGSGFAQRFVEQPA